MDANNRAGSLLQGLVGVALITALAVAACGGSGATTPASGATSTLAESSSASASPGGATSGCPTVTTQAIKTPAAAGWRVNVNMPVVSGVPTASLMNDAINAKLTSFAATLIGGLTSSDGGLSTLDGGFAVGLCSSTLLSFRFAVTAYESGAATSFEVVSSINLVVSTGEAIHLSDIFTTSAAALPVLKSQAHDLLIAADPYLGGGILVWPSSPTMSFFENCWVITAAGLELAWNQNDIAPSSSGSPRVTIPWPTLHDVINPSGPAGEFL